ncbi:MAG: type IV secretory system conjugative DNA transfer family protein [Aggregatilineales bacterium]
MIYWLFTDARMFSLYVVPPMLCLSICLPFIYILVNGVGIKRDDSERSPGKGHSLRIAAHLALSLLVVAGFLFLLGDMAIQSGKPLDAVWFEFVVGSPRTINGSRLLQFSAGMLAIVAGTNMGLAGQLKMGSSLRERIDRLRRPSQPRGEEGSSHFCTPREYKRFRRMDAEGILFRGAFWGANGVRLDNGEGQFCLSGEDSSRGILALGGPGSGKSQAVILPVIADRMQARHSLIITDPQGELTPHILQMASVTGHLVAVHDPTRDDTPRYNLAQDIRTISDARAISEVLVPSAHGDNKFWSDSAIALLSACLLRFGTLGEIFSALGDMQALADKFTAQDDDGRMLANSFIASVRQDGKLASNIVATLATALAGWAAQSVRETTSGSDFSAVHLVNRPMVIVLTCPGRTRQVYAPYLGAVLRKLMLDLDSIGEARGGALPTPVAVVIDEFPALGRLDSLVTDVNLVRKRRISIVIAAQSRGQFQLIYGQAGTDSLLSGLATQIVFGGCDAETAGYFSKASGQTTEKPTADSYPRQRQLLTPDEVQSPSYGNSLIFARYVEENYAAQVVLSARLTRFYERTDWQTRFANTKDKLPKLMKRRTSSTQKPSRRITTVKPPQNWRRDRE